MARRAGELLASSPTSMMAVGPDFVSLAQQEEQRPFNPLVEGSTPSGDTNERDE